MPSRSSSRTLTDHEEIRRWAEERGARPSTVRSTHGQDNVGIIRLDFPGYSGADSLEEVTWDEWFEDFDDNNLALLVQDETANGQKSNFNKLISRESAESGETPRRQRRASARSSRGGSRSSRRTASSRSESGGSRRRASGSSQQKTRRSSGRASSSSSSSRKKSSRSTSGRQSSTGAQHRSQKKQSGRSSSSSRRRAA